MSRINTKPPIALPTGWNLDPLDKVAEVIDCKHRTPIYTDEGYPVVRPRDVREVGICLDQCLRTSYEEYKDLTEKRQPQIGDIVYSRNASFGVASLVTNQTPFAIGQDVCLIVPKTVDSSYLYRLLNAPFVKQQLDLVISGSTFKRINLSEIRKLKILLPPIDEQRRIAAILDRADAVRRKRQEAIALTEELLRSTFLEMFGDPITNPKNWNVVKLQDVCRRITDGTHQPPDWAIEGIPFLFVSNIIGGEIDFNVSKYITEETWISLNSRCPTELNDILYTTVGSYGNAALVRTERKFSFQRHIAHIKPDSSKIHPEFLVGLMQSDGIKRQADKQVRGIAQKTLNLRELKEFRVFVPPREEQNRYVSLQRRVESCLRNQRYTFINENNLFNSLLQRAFRGEL